MVCAGPPWPQLLHNAAGTARHGMRLDSHLGAQCPSRLALPPQQEFLGQMAAASLPHKCLMAKGCKGPPPTHTHIHTARATAATSTTPIGQAEGSQPWAGGGTESCRRPVGRAWKECGVGRGALRSAGLWPPLSAPAIQQRRPLHDGPTLAPSARLHPTPCPSSAHYQSAICLTPAAPSPTHSTLGHHSIMARTTGQEGSRSTKHPKNFAPGAIAPLPPSTLHLCVGSKMVSDHKVLGRNCWHRRKNWV